MSCILRLAGTALSVDELSRRGTIKPYRVDRKGEPARIKSRGVNPRSGAHFLVSEREFDDLGGQVLDAIAFLEANRNAIRDLVTFPGVEIAVLDFGVAWRDVVVQSDSFPADLLRLAGDLGLGLEITHYPVSGSPAVEGAGA